MAVQSSDDASAREVYWKDFDSNLTELSPGFLNGRMDPSYSLSASLSVIL